MDRRGRPVLDGDLVPDSRSRTDAPAGTDPGTQLFIAASLLILAGLAWAWTVAMAAMPECHRMGLPSFVLMWTVMMAAMMFPAVIPVALTFTALARARRGNPGLAAAVFVGGYLRVGGLLGGRLSRGGPGRRRARGASRGPGPLRRRRSAHARLIGGARWRRRRSRRRRGSRAGS